MKKIIALILTTLLLTNALSACGNTPAQAPQKNEDIHIVATIFPAYDWVMSVLGEEADHADVTFLLDNGVDLHSYQPTATDILNISTCDLFIYVGGESDEWVEDALETAVNKDMKVINLLKVLGSAAKEEDLVEGMQETAHDHDHEDDAGEAGRDHEEADDETSRDHEEADGEVGRDQAPEYDEHVWLSLRNAALFVEAISDALISIDNPHAGTYQANAAAYTAQLSALDESYAAAIADAPLSTLLFGDRFPFRYLTDDYNLSYYAAFTGCSAETEASFETVTFLAGKVDALSLHAVITLEGGDRRIAETIVDNTASKDQAVLVLNSMQSVKAEDIAAGASYLAIMENNLEVLKEALR